MKYTLRLQLYWFGTVDHEILMKKQKRFVKNVHTHKYKTKKKKGVGGWVGRECWRLLSKR